jgi:predicted enzyme related to lactoylglutathione lyase
LPDTKGGKMDSTKITRICMGSVYTNDFPKAFDFYSRVLGLESSPMGESASYMSINDNDGLFLDGGYEVSDTKGKKSKSTFTFQVGSALAMYEKLKSEGIELIQKEPMKMNETEYWFQCYDPVGNTVEFIGEE